MINIHNILRPNDADPHPRAHDAWERIQDKPTQITIKRVGTPQTVRIETANTVQETEGAAGQSSVRRTTVFGIRGHETKPDTDIQRGDRFAHNGVQYRVIDVVLTLGEKQAYCEATE